MVGPCRPPPGRKLEGLTHPVLLGPRSRSHIARYRLFRSIEPDTDSLVCDQTMGSHQLGRHLPRGSHSAVTLPVYLQR